MAIGTPLKKQKIAHDLDTSAPSSQNSLCASPGPSPAGKSLLKARVRSLTIVSGGTLADGASPPSEVSSQIMPVTVQPSDELPSSRDSKPPPPSSTCSSKSPHVALPSVVAAKGHSASDPADSHAAAALVTPSVVVAAPGRSIASCQRGAVEDTDVSKPLWAAHPHAPWEVHVHSSVGILGPTFTVRGVKRCSSRTLPIVAWEYPLFCPAQCVAVGGDIAVVGAGCELHVLMLASGRLILPPFVLVSRLVRVELYDRSLVVLCADGGLLVYDLHDMHCSTSTSLRHICVPREIELLTVKPKSLEPLIRLHDGRAFAFVRCSWTRVSGGFKCVSLDTADAQLEAARIASDLLVVLAMGSAALASGFCLMLRCFIRLLVDSDNYGEVRLWSSALLGKATISQALVSTRLCLAADLRTIGLEGRALIEDVVLPAIGALPDQKLSVGAQELRNELAAMLHVESRTPRQKLPETEGLAQREARGGT